MARGVTHSVWVNDSLKRLETIARELSLSEMTLKELERLEQLAVKIHTDNLHRLPKQPEIIEEQREAMAPKVAAFERAWGSLHDAQCRYPELGCACRAMVLILP